MYTPTQVSMKLKVPVNLIYKRIKILDLKPLKVNGYFRYYDLNDFQEIRTRSHIDIMSAKSKMMIIEYWSIMKYKYDQDIADELGIKLDKMHRILLELRKNDNCVIIKSKLC
jgi:hypothetical protein